MLLADVYHLPVWASLAFITLTLTASVVLSLRATAPEEVPEPSRVDAP
jgi:hypothetical protein